MVKGIFTTVASVYLSSSTFLHAKEFESPRDSAEKNLFLIVNNGFTACGYEVTEAGDRQLGVAFAGGEFQKILQDAESRGVKVTTIISCIGPENDLIWTHVPELRYQKYGDWNTEVREAFDGFFPESITSAYSQGKYPDLMERYFAFTDREYAKLPKGTPVVIVGHSYGAWLSMAQSYRTYMPISRLVTNDPISPVDCNIAKALAGDFLWSYGCYAAPADLKPAYPVVRKVTPYWVNVYQNTQLALHSSRIEEAHANWRLTFSTGGVFDFDYHIRVWTSPEFWGWLNELVKGVSPDP